MMYRCPCHDIPAEWECPNNSIILEPDEQEEQKINVASGEDVDYEGN